ncbi:MAG: hypothetical protein HYZ34_00820 [Ignavibacteriae bacterium]|nr:hypothetical protein [Ignavibacteriota bacterium]
MSYKSSVLLVALMCSFSIAFSRDMQSDDSIKSNLEIFRLGITTLTDSIFNSLSSENRKSLLLSIQSEEERSFVRQVVVSELQRKGTQVFLDSSSTNLTTHELQIVAPVLKVSYGDSFHGGFLGESKTNRTVTISFPFIIKENQTNKVLASGTLPYSYSDTVATTMIPMLEQEGIPSTHAPLPEGSIFDKLLEPFIIIGATGIAVYLFFHVRS